MSSLNNNENNLATSLFGQSSQNNTRTAKPEKEVKTYRENEVISDLIESSFDDGKDDANEDNPSEQGLLKLEDITDLNQSQKATVNPNMIDAKVTSDTLVGATDSLASFSMTFSKSSIFNLMHLNSLASLIKAKPEDLKFVRLAFRASWHLNDTDMANMGAVFGAKMGQVEYLSLDFYRTKRVTIFGIHRLVTALSGPLNSIKALRIRVRRMRYLDQQNLREMIGLLRMTLVNLEELTLVSAGNLFVLNMNSLRDKDRKIQGLGLGLKKYEVKNHVLSLVSLVIDDAGKDMSRYIREKFAGKGLTEGHLLSQRIIMFHKVIIFNRTSNNKVLVATQKS